MRRTAGAFPVLLFLAFLGAACGASVDGDATSGDVASADVATSESPATTDADTDAGRSLDSPDDSGSAESTGSNGTATHSDGTEDPEATSTTDSSSTVPTNAPASADPTVPGSPTSKPSVNLATTTAATPTSAARTTAPTSTTTTTTTTTTTAAPTAKPSRIDLPAQVGSTEGIAVDSSTGRVFVGELSNGNIWVGGLNTEPYTLFSSGAASGRSTALGLATDVGRGRLYVVSPANNRVDILNLGSGGLVASVSIPVMAGSLVNDVTVASDGTVYITDSGRPIIYRISPGSTTATLWLDYSTTNAVQTSAVTQHGNGIVANSNYLLVAYMIGGELLRIDRSTGAVTRVPVSGAPTAGRDGLVLCGNRLYGVDITSLAGGQDTVWITQLASDWSSGTAAGNIRSSSFSSASTAAELDGSLIVVNAQFGVSPKVTPFWLSVESASC